MRKFINRTSANIAQFKLNLIAVCNKHDTAILLNSQGYSDGAQWFSKEANFDLLAGLGVINTSCHKFDQLKDYAAGSTDWLFGYISYDTKNSIEKKLTSKNPDRIGFDELLFFTPRFVLTIEDNSIKIGYRTDKNSAEDAQKLFEQVENATITAHQTEPKRDIQQSISKTDYINNVNKIKEHIHIGNIYEINYCMEFYGQKASLNPENTYLNLTKLSPTPFSAYIKQNNRYLLSASPERYIKKWGQRVISQPIKGTIKRDSDKTVDNNLKNNLKNNPKEQAENIMITDLVRNDLSKIAKRGTVKVEELMGLYSFPQVHQLISTISAEVDKNVTWIDIIAATFPMGSMTGAPKLKSMQLIEEFEDTKRGLYSGSVGYVTPEGNFDFNVVIRSLLYNAETENLSFMVGSAITANSNAEKEYEECLLKAAALHKAINSTQ